MAKKDVLDRQGHGSYEGSTTIHENYMVGWCIDRAGAPSPSPKHNNDTSNSSKDGGRKKPPPLGEHNPNKQDSVKLLETSVPRKNVAGTKTQNAAQSASVGLIGTTTTITRRGIFQDAEEESPTKDFFLTDIDTVVGSCGDTSTTVADSRAPVVQKENGNPTKAFAVPASSLIGSGRGMGRTLPAWMTRKSGGVSPSSGDCPNASASASVSASPSTSTTAAQSASESLVETTSTAKRGIFQDAEEESPIKDFFLNDPDTTFVMGSGGDPSATVANSRADAVQKENDNPTKSLAVPASPSMGRGRGMGRTLPAWMTREVGRVSPASGDRPNASASDSTSTAVSGQSTESSASCVQPNTITGRGRGMGRTMPAWMTRQQQSSAFSAPSTDDHGEIVVGEAGTATVHTCTRNTTNEKETDVLPPSKVSTDNSATTTVDPNCGTSENPIEVIDSSSEDSIAAPTDIPNAAKKKSGSRQSNEEQKGKPSNPIAEVAPEILASLPPCLQEFIKATKVTIKKGQMIMASSISFKECAVCGEWKTKPYFANSQFKGNDRKKKRACKLCVSAHSPKEIEAALHVTKPSKLPKKTPSKSSKAPKDSSASYYGPAAANDSQGTGNKPTVVSQEAVSKVPKDSSNSYYGPTVASDSQETGNKSTVVLQEPVSKVPKDSSKTCYGPAAASESQETVDKSTEELQEAVSKVQKESSKSYCGAAAASDSQETVDKSTEESQEAVSKVPKDSSKSYCSPAAASDSQETLNKSTEVLQDAVSKVPKDGSKSYCSPAAANDVQMESASAPKKHNLDATTTQDETKDPNPPTKKRKMQIKEKGSTETKKTSLAAKTANNPLASRGGHTSRTDGGQYAAPLPKGWNEFWDERSERYFYQNSNTGTTQWDRPTAPATSSSGSQGGNIPYQRHQHSFPSANPLPQGWNEVWDERTGKPYYHNTYDGSTQWNRPTARATAYY